MVGDDRSDCFRDSFIVCCFWLLVARASWASPGRIKTWFRGLVSFGWLWFFHYLFDDGVVAVGQSVATVIAVKGRGETTDIYALPYSPFMPVRLSRQDFYVLLAEMVLAVRGMLHYGRLIHTRSCLGSRKVFCVAGRGSSC